ncbi:MAG TPA: LytTR family DNA-binding domain-containing protein [Bacteroidia bacterium]|nr:LytTR family DNA-binding domain-containing protein [Bacteroidia bacterium]
MKIRCIIVDDEPFARKGIAEYVSEIDFLELKAQCESALDANKVLGQVRKDSFGEKIDLVFLDIQMPGLSGLELLKSLKFPPMAILISAYPEYAIDGFNLDVIDYLLKPVSFERFLKACNKARDYFNTLHPVQVSTPTENYFFVKSENKIEKVFFSEILYVKALQNYVEIHLENKRLVAYLTFKNIETFLPADQFVKVHKSYIVAVPAIKNIEGNYLQVGKQQIPISRQNKEEILKTILSNRYLKR